MSVTTANCFHLTVAIVREIHAEALAKIWKMTCMGDLY